MRLRIVGLLGVSLLVAGCEQRRPSTSSPERRDSRATLALASAAAPADRALLDDSSIDWQANATMRVLGKVALTLEDSQYTYGLSVDEKRGIYRFDCSGMAQWVLRRSAPTAAAAMAYKLDGRPLARDFQRRIARAPTDVPRNGWRRVARVRDMLPGDVIAWLKPVEIESPNTGHVAFVILPPVLAPGYENAYLVRIADSTRLLHHDDTREGRSGFGFGTILVVADPDTDAPIAYGWVALEWRAFETKIAIGRPVTSDETHASRKSRAR